MRGNSRPLTHNPTEALNQTAAVTPLAERLREIQLLIINVTMQGRSAKALWASRCVTSVRRLFCEECQRGAGETHVRFGDERSAGDGEAVFHGAEVLRHDGQATALSAPSACC